MKVKKLIVDYTFDFELYGVVTSLKDYKFAWLINQQIAIKLIRSDDYLLESGSSQMQIINYKFEEELSEFRLFKNKAVVEAQNTQQYLVPEMKHFDYFILVRGNIHTFAPYDLLNCCGPLQVCS